MFHSLFNTVSLLSNAWWTNTKDEQWRVDKVGGEESVTVGDFIVDFVEFVLMKCLQSISLNLSTQSPKLRVLISFCLIVLLLLGLSKGAVYVDDQAFGADLKNVSANTVILDNSASFHSHTGSDKLHHAPKTSWFASKWCLQFVKVWRRTFTVHWV